MTKTQLFLLDDVVVDERLYPRKLLNNFHVNDIVRAFQAGATIPPIILDKRTHYLIDGRHRTEAAKKLGIEALPAELRSYPNEAAMLEEAIQLNIHGQSLSHFDMAHCVVLAKAVGLSQDRLAVAMSTTKNFVSELWTRKTAYHDGELVAIKRSHEHLAQQPLTPKQFLANEKSNGMHCLVAANQLINLLDGEVINWENPRIVEKLEQLYIRLRKEFRDEVRARTVLRKDDKVRSRGGKVRHAPKSPRAGVSHRLPPQPRV